MRAWRRVGWLAGCVLVAACGGQSSYHSDRSGNGGSRAASGGGSGTPVAGESWLLQPGDFSDDQAYGVGVDAMDNVLVLRVRGLELGGRPTAMLEKYSPLGALTWNVEISDSAPALLAVHANGNSITAGTVNETDATGSPSNHVLITAYDSGGKRRWTSRLDSEGPVAVLALNVGPNGHTFLLWVKVAAATANDNVFSELDEKGDLLSSSSTRDPGPVYESAIDRGGNLLEAGGAAEHFIREHDSQGNELWTTPLGGTPTGLYGDDEGSALAVILLSTGRGSLAKFDAGGTLLFGTDFGNDTEYATLVVGDPFGRSFTVGTLTPGSGDTWDVVARRFDVDGTVLGTWPLASDQRDQPMAVAADSTGALLVVGMTQGAFPGQKNAGGADSFIARIAP